MTLMLIIMFRMLTSTNHFFFLLQLTLQLWFLYKMRWFSWASGRSSCWRFRIYCERFFSVAVFTVFVSRRVVDLWFFSLFMLLCVSRFMVNLGENITLISSVISFIFFRRLNFESHESIENYNKAMNQRNKR